MTRKSTTSFAHFFLRFPKIQVSHRWIENKQEDQVRQEVSANVLPAQATLCNDCGRLVDPAQIVMEIAIFPGEDVSAMEGSREPLCLAFSWATASQQLVDLTV
jgi:hypothetical protein